MARCPLPFLGNFDWSWSKWRECLKISYCKGVYWSACSFDLLRTSPLGGSIYISGYFGLFFSFFLPLISLYSNLFSYFSGFFSWSPNFFPFTSRPLSMTLPSTLCSCGFSLWVKIDFFISSISWLSFLLVYCKFPSSCFGCFFFYLSFYSVFSISIFFIPSFWSSCWFLCFYFFISFSMLFYLFSCYWFLCLF